MIFHILWGSDPSIQFECNWLQDYLLDFADVVTIWSSNSSIKHILDQGHYPILIESGIKRLENNPSIDTLSELHQARIFRLECLNKFPSYSIIHLSDEEGYDADSWYSLVPPNITIFRNFHHSRLLSLHRRIKSFPIGPRDLFIKPEVIFDDLTVSSQRRFPWSFMGTLWESGSRKLCVSLFLSYLPNGFYYGGKRFGSGLSLPNYKYVLSNSVFALTPEGDRHLDTFRLWESLSCGCIPLVVDYKSAAKHLLPSNYPLPIFRNWHDALAFAQHYLQRESDLDVLQSVTFSWWSSYKKTIRSQLQSTFIKQ